MSYPNKDLTEHANAHFNRFFENCDYCEQAKEVGIWQNGTFYTFAEIREMEKSQTDEG